MQAETLTRASWQQLLAVNADVNAKIVPETDQDNYHVAEYWTYPADGRGDCEDIALEKRRELIADRLGSERAADDGRARSRTATATPC